MTESQFKGFIISLLRRGTYRWRPRNEAKKKSKIGRNKYVCANCQKIFGNKDIKADHIVPVVGIEGFISWDEYIKRMFPDESGFQMLCRSCHDEKTKTENGQRKEYRQKNKQKKS